MSEDVLVRLAGEVRAMGGLLEAAVVEPGREPAAEPPYGAQAAAGPRSASAPEEYALLVEAIREGAALHYAEGRVVRPEDPDLALLAGDRLYAVGLARLAELGDLAAVVELADVISLDAQTHAEGRPADAEAAWAAGVRAVAAGGGPEHEAAKAAWRAGGARA